MEGPMVGRDRSSPPGPYPVDDEARVHERDFTHEEDIVWPRPRPSELVHEEEASLRTTAVTLTQRTRPTFEPMNEICACDRLP